MAGAHTANTCFLCEAAKASIATSNNLLITSSEQVVVVLNRYPYNAGHLLVAPRIHEGSLPAIPPQVAAELMEILQWSVRVVTAELKPHGINVGANLGSASGAGVPDHLHIHVVPRWQGDTNFMPVLAEVKVISESQEIMRARLIEAFQRLPRL